MSQLSENASKILQEKNLVNGIEIRPVGPPLCFNNVAQRYHPVSGFGDKFEQICNYLFDEDIRKA